MAMHTEPLTYLDGQEICRGDLFGHLGGPYGLVVRLDVEEALNHAKQMTLYHTVTVFWDGRTFLVKWMGLGHTYLIARHRGRN